MSGYICDVLGEQKSKVLCVMFRILMMIRVMFFCNNWRHYHLQMKSQM